MAAQQLIVDVTANNLANINTNGFKRSQVDFQDLIYVKLKEANREEADGVQAPTGLEIGNGVRPASTTRVSTQGEMQNTSRPLDVSIEGDGFFRVRMPGGELRYTRDGSLRINGQGNLVTSTGMLIDPAITLGTDARSISIGQDGTITVMTGSSDTPSTVGRLSLSRFANPAGLSAEGRNLFAATQASGDAETNHPGAGGLGLLQQGFLEKSNVQMVTELVNLITAQRAYEVNSRAIKAGDQMLSTANRLLGG